MSEINSNNSTNSTGNNKQNQDQKTDQIPLGISFQGGKGDLGLDPGNYFNRSLVNKKTKITAKIDNYEVSFGSDEIDQVRKDLETLYEKPAVVQKAIKLFPAFQGYAEKKGYKNPHAVALAIEHYAATKEFVSNYEKANLN
jgi:hypothetical protein